MFKKLLFAFVFFFISSPAFAATYSLPLTVRTYKNCLDGTSGWVANGSAASEIIGGAFGCYMFAAIKIPWEKVTSTTDLSSGVIHWQYISATNNFLSRLYRSDAIIDFVAAPRTALSTPDYSPMLFDRSVALGDVSYVKTNNLGFLMPGVYPNGGYARVPSGTFTITFNDPAFVEQPPQPMEEYSIPLTAKTFEYCSDTIGWVPEGTAHSSFVGGVYGCYMSTVMNVPWDQVLPDTDLSSGVLRWQYTSALNDFYPFLFYTNAPVDFTGIPSSSVLTIDYPPKLFDNAAALGDLTHVKDQNLGLMMSGVYPNGGWAFIPLNTYTLNLKRKAHTYNTTTGNGVEIWPPDQNNETPVQVIFTTVTQAGDTTLTTSGSGQAPPSGFRLGAPPLYYNLSTTAAFIEAEVCIYYSGTSLDTNTNKENTYKLFHFENGAWVDKTTSRDTTANKICGMTNSFSPFAVFDPNSSPEVSSITSIQDPVQIETNVSASVEFTDPDIMDYHTAQWDWGDGTTTEGIINEQNGLGTITGNHVYTTPGVYTLTVRVTDEFGLVSESVFQFIVVYDPMGGFITGGGTILSPQGAYTADTSLSGKANFGFVSKYEHGASIPTGSTEFIFHIGNMKFKSNSYDWLVVAGQKAQFKGSGTINNTGDYGFMLTAIDGQRSGSVSQDKFRIKIIHKATNSIVYDNQLNADDSEEPTTSIHTGSIVLH